MYKARYYKADGKKGKARALPDAIFDGVVNDSVMHQVVKAHLSNQRQGTAAAKSRGEVAGGSSKPWRQKGTGRARAGTIRAVQWTGGGVAHPPVPHSWRQRVPKKVRALARRSALNDRAESDRVVLVDVPALEKPKTRDLVGFLGAIEAEGKTLVLTDGRNENAYLSARNLDNVIVMPFGEESVYDVLWANIVAIERSAVEKEAEPKKAKAAPKKKAAPKAEAAPEPEAAVETKVAEPAEAAEASAETEEGDDA